VSDFVLVPGAGGAAWYWHRVVELLVGAGHSATAVELPGDDPDAGLSEYRDLVLAAIANRPGVILVAQSLGAFVAPLVAAKTTLGAVVLLNPMTPSPGETPGDWWEHTGSETARIRAAERGGYPADFDVDSYFLHDVDPALAAAGAEHQHNEAPVVFNSICDFDAWPDVPIRVLTGAQDRFFPADFQQTVARDRLGVEPDLVPGGHLASLSQPRSIADYLDRLPAQLI
jgi:Alpha/beta hydrolase family